MTPKLAAIPVSGRAIIDAAIEIIDITNVITNLNDQIKMFRLENE